MRILRKKQKIKRKKHIFSKKIHNKSVKKFFGGNMKKLSKILPLCLILVLCFGFAGCATGNSSASLSYTLEYNVNKLTNILKKTEEASTSDLVIPEIYSAGTNGDPTEKLKQGDLMILPSIDEQIVDSEEIEKDKSSTSPKTTLSSSKFGTYTPRHISNVNYANSGFNSYLGKVEDLYVMVNDAVSVNDSICLCRNNIFAYCQFLSDIAQQLKENKIELSEEQTTACNSLLKELSKSTNKLTDTRNEVSNSCKNLSQKKSLSNGIDAISSKYVTVVNCLDNRLTNYQNILAILSQLQCVLNGTCSSNSTENSNVLENLENFKDLLNNNSSTNQKCFTDENGKTYCLDENGNLFSIDENGNKNYLQNCQNGNCTSNNLFQNGTCPNSTSRTISSKNQLNPRKIADYNTFDEEKERNVERKSNIDTFGDKTISPNVIKKENVNKDENKEENSEDLQTNPPIEFPNNSNTYGYGNGIYGTQINGISGGYGINGAYGNGFGGAYGGYNGVHNFENGITNPYRNTDTYKFPPQTSTPLGTGYVPGANLTANALQNTLGKPLPQEKRQDFKAFGAPVPNLEIEEKNDVESDLSNEIQIDNSSMLEEEIVKEETLPTETEQEICGEKICDRLI